MYEGAHVHVWMVNWRSLRCTMRVSGQGRCARCTGARDCAGGCQQLPTRPVGALGMRADCARWGGRATWGRRSRGGPASDRSIQMAGPGVLFVQRIGAPPRTVDVRCGVQLLDEFGYGTGAGWKHDGMTALHGGR